jgi:hypothetical protein
MLSVAWRAGHMACLVKEAGTYLTHTDPHLRGAHRLGRAATRWTRGFRPPCPGSTLGGLPGLSSLKPGIGLHAGEVVGNIGSESRAKYGIVGTGGNLTHRLQAEARGGEVALSQAAFDHLPERPAVKNARCCFLRGLKEPVMV